MSEEDRESIERLRRIRERRRTDTDAQRAQLAREAEGPSPWETYAAGEEAQARRDRGESERRP